jgi:hypothetical protein
MRVLPEFAVINLPVSYVKAGTLNRYVPRVLKNSAYLSQFRTFFLSTRHNFRDFQGETGTLRFSQPTSSVADPDPGSGAFLTPGSGMEKNPDPG